MQATDGFYNFSNIRYAEPPIGELRFRAPVPVKGSDNTTVNTGSVGVICPQSSPGWGQIADKFFPDYLEGIPFNLSATEAANNASSTGASTKQDPRTSEDCLFLDVIVPQQVFNAQNGTSGAPVMVWFYGGYTFGNKAGSGNPAGLLKASQNTGGPGVIYVSFNYRVSGARPILHEPN